MTKSGMIAKANTRASISSQRMVGQVAAVAAKVGVAATSRMAAKVAAKAGRLLAEHLRVWVSMQRLDGRPCTLISILPSSNFDL